MEEYIFPFKNIVDEIYTISLIIDSMPTKKMAEESDECYQSWHTHVGEFNSILLALRYGYNSNANYFYDNLFGINSTDRHIYVQRSLENIFFAMENAVNIIRKFVDNKNQTTDKTIFSLLNQYLTICDTAVRYIIDTANKFRIYLTEEFILMTKKVSESYYDLLIKPIDKPNESGQNLNTETEPPKVEQTIRIIDSKTLELYFKPQFKGMGSNINNLATFIQDLQVDRTAKDFAKIAFLAYDGKGMNNRKPKTFSKWLSIFFRAIGRQNEYLYKPCELKDIDESLKKVFSYLL